MAFLCSARVKRNKKTKDIDKPPTRQPILGRITGSASIETLVRVGIEKENGLSPDSKMVVLHDFNPCVDDELEVKRGQIVNILYQEKGWIYVIAENNLEGFIPHSYCAPFGSHLADLALNVKHKKALRNGLDPSNGPHTIHLESTNEISHNNQHQNHLNNTSHHRLTHSNNNSSTHNLNINHHHHNNNTINSNNINNINSNHNNNNITNTANNNIINSTNLNGSNSLHHGSSHFHHHSSSHHLTHHPHHYSNSHQSLHETDPSSRETRCPLTGKTTEEENTAPSVEISPFNKDPSGHYIVLFTFIARDENDVSVERGESVTVLNKDDSDWFWIVRSDGQEGFVPSAFLCPFEMIQDPGIPHHQPAANSSAPTSNGNSCSSINRIPNGIESGASGDGGGGSGSISAGGGGIGIIDGVNHSGSNGLNNHHHHLSNHNSTQPNSNSFHPDHATFGGVCGPHDPENEIASPLPPPSQEDDETCGELLMTPIIHEGGRPFGTELVMLYDYKAQAPDDLSVRRGDWIYANYNNQTVDGWLWAYAPKLSKYGFIPKAYARPPAITS